MANVVRPPSNNQAARKLYKFKVVGWTKNSETGIREAGRESVIQAINAHHAALQYARDQQIQAWELEDGTQQPKVIIRCERA